MKTDFDPIVWAFERPIKIVPVGDVHLGAIEHDVQAWDAFIKRVKDDKDLYVILLGDLINNSVRTSVANPFDELLRPSDQKAVMTSYLEEIKDRILCCCSGNHEARTRKDSDQDITRDIMCKLDLEDLYRENMVFMKISIGSRKAGDGEKARSTFTFCVTHGGGGGIYTGASVNREERFGNILEGVDALITGHTHKGHVTRPARICFNPHANTVRMRPYLAVSCASWLSYGGYAMRKMLLPAESAQPLVMYLNDSTHGKPIEVKW